MQAIANFSPGPVGFLVPDWRAIPRATDLAAFEAGVRQREAQLRQLAIACIAATVLPFLLFALVLWAAPQFDPLRGVLLVVTTLGATATAAIAVHWHTWREAVTDAQRRVPASGENLYMFWAMHGHLVRPLWPR